MKVVKEMRSRIEWFPASIKPSVLNGDSSKPILFRLNSYGLEKDGIRAGYWNGKRRRWVNEIHDLLGYEFPEHHVSHWIPLDMLELNTKPQ